MMTHHNRMLTALKRMEPDRVPYDLNFSPALLKRFKQETGTEDYIEYYNLDMRVVDWGNTNKKNDYSSYLSVDSEVLKNIDIDEWGVGHLRGSLYHFSKQIHPLKNIHSVKELEKYPFPDITEEYRFYDISDKIKVWHDKKYFVGGGVGSIFEQAWALRSMDNLLMDFIDNEDMTGFLLDKITKIRCFMARIYAGAGVDMVMLGDDVGLQKGMIMSPWIWRKWLKPRLAQVIGAATEINPDIQIWYHSCGDIKSIISELIEVGITVLNPVQPECMDSVEIKKKYGKKLTLWGTIGTQTTMPFGTPGEVRHEVKKRIETVGRGGGLVIGPTHVLEPDVPWENVEAFVEAVREFGRK